MAIVEVPSRYRVPTRGEARIEVEEDTIRKCIEALENRFPGFGELILDASGHQRRFVRLFLNGDVLERDALDRCVGSQDTITIVAGAAGG